VEELWEKFVVVYFEFVNSSHVAIYYGYNRKVLSKHLL